MEEFIERDIAEAKEFDATETKAPRKQLSRRVSARAEILFRLIYCKSSGR
ncbi:hypothetical protein M1M98_00785 [Thermodesulfovibrionales bacterium]|nr:hypothetical protein [Thermodesulfovibrionales bacterium]MCL0046798.1 hypothetical protein [Thermodesulfovibrionales bacterium]MCL0051226.1 hypothetical protein [Thermodesulfovibrionales bacterium]MCL0086446.1 hypothetical protein [Thermodesulfovibrionales bacterium]